MFFNFQFYPVTFAVLKKQEKTNYNLYIIFVHIKLVTLPMSKLENPADLRTWWCLYLGCTGVGLTAITDQLCNSEQKLLCLAQSAELRLTDIMGQMGLCLDNSRCLCVQSGQQIIPTKPFIEVVGIRIFGPPKASGEQTASRYCPCRKNNH